MQLFSVHEVIEQAVRTERLGYEFYTAVSDRFEKDEKLKELFDTLAANEKVHEKTFSAFLERIEDERPENWEDASAYLRAIVESEFFLGNNKSLLSLDQVKTTAEAVHFAIGFEKETLLYFYTLRDVVREKEFINEIINEEKSHIMWLSELRRTLTG